MAAVASPRLDSDVPPQGHLCPPGTFVTPQGHFLPPLSPRGAACWHRGHSHPGGFAPKGERCAGGGSHWGDPTSPPGSTEPPPQPLARPRSPGRLLQGVVGLVPVVLCLQRELRKRTKCFSGSRIMNLPLY